eukprot:NODE_30_length_37342_cov_0.449507.p13 type:complete len:343 gc:universal NODE_30_length_37342_cov_0.449507:18441-17413(-)
MGLSPVNFMASTLGSASKKILKVGKPQLPAITSSYTTDYQYRPTGRVAPLKPPVKPYLYENLLNTTSTYDESFKGFSNESYLVQHVKKQYPKQPDSKFEGESGYVSEFKPIAMNGDARTLMRQFKDNQTHRLKPNHLEFTNSLYGNDYVSFGLENGDKSRFERRKLMEKLSSYKKTVNGDKFVASTVYSEFKYTPTDRVKSLKPLEKPIKPEKLQGVSSYDDSFKKYPDQSYKVDHVKAKYTIPPISSLSGNSSYDSDFTTKDASVTEARTLKDQIKLRQTHKLPLTHLEYNDSVYGSDFKDIGLENGLVSRMERKNITSKLSSFRQTVGSQTFQPMLVFSE